MIYTNYRPEYICDTFSPISSSSTYECKHWENTLNFHSGTTWLVVNQISITIVTKMKWFSACTRQHNHYGSIICDKTACQSFECTKMPLWLKNAVIITHPHPPFNYCLHSGWVSNNMGHFRTFRCTSKVFKVLRRALHDIPKHMTKGLFMVNSQVAGTRKKSMIHLWRVASDVLRTRPS